MTVLTRSIEGISITNLSTLARVCIYTGLASVMLCVPLMNKCFCAAVILFFLSGNWLRVWPVLLKNKIIIVSLILIVLFAMGIFYSEASSHMALRVFNKYVKLFYLLFFIPLFTQKKTRNTALFIFILGVMVSEIITYLHFFNLFSFGYGQGKHWLFVQDIDAGYIVSLTAYLLANYCVDNKKYRWPALFCFAVCSVDILFLNEERTGYLIYLSLAGLFLLQRLKWRGLLSALIGIPLLFGALYFSSAKFSDRVNQVISNVSDYHQGKESTSIGLRLAFAQYSFGMIKQHWLTGVGTGSFQELYRHSGSPSMIDGTWPAHPHNEYISILFQLGIIGLLTSLYWFYLQVRESFYLPKPDRWLLQGVIAGFFLLGFCNASLLVNPASGLYITFLALFLALKYDGNELDWNAS